MIVEGKKLQQNRTEKPDALVIGSGAGGAVVAAKLAAGGMKVLVVEEGGKHDRHDFTPYEGEMFQLMYQEHGNRATADQGIMILQGRTLGGGTTINWTASFRTPRKTLDHWRDKHGVEGITEETLRPHFEAVEKRLNIHTDPDLVSENNQLLWDGCKKLGWEVDLVPRNVRDCIGLSICGLGCPVDARLSMHLTYLVDAVQAGATIYTNARADKIELENGRVKRVQCTFLDEDKDQPNGYGLTIEPKLCVLAGGAINSPLLLLRSGIGNASGKVGRRTFFHVCTALRGIHDRKIEGYTGAPLSVHSHQHAYPDDGSMGYFIECPEFQPMLMSIAAPGFGAAHRAPIEQLPYYGVNISLHKDGFSDQERGATVTPKPSGQPKIEYHYTDRLYDSIRRGLKSMARVQLAAGAKEVRTLHEDTVVIKSEKDLGLIDKAKLGPGHMIMFSAHQMGGCQMGGDARSSVLRSDMRHHDIENLWVADGSVFPTSSGVNPQETIFALASMAADKILRA